MNRKRNFLIGSSVLALIIACGARQSAGEDAIQESAATGDGPMVPMFEVDPLWPKSLPEHWLMGPTVGVDVDSTDMIWLVHRNTPDQFLAGAAFGLEQAPPVGECCQPSPPVLAFDQEGNLVHSWGGPGTEIGDYVWPESNHRITVDYMDNVWIGGNGPADSHVLKFTKDGTFLMQIGIPGARQTAAEDGQPFFDPDSNSMNSYGRVAKIGIDPEANEAYFADGYFNKRVAVVDADSGELKRYWGAYGNEPDDDYDFGGPYQPGDEPSQQFRGPVHCSEISNDGLVYVCDRSGNRIQVFQRAGTFIEEVVIAPSTLAEGSSWDIDFSHDPEQQFLYLANGQNMKVYIIDRASLEVLTAFGTGGRQPGMFLAVHSIAVDSNGNIYTTEIYEGSRIQKFVYTGMGRFPRGRKAQTARACSGRRTRI